MTRRRAFILSLFLCIFPLLPGQSWVYYDSLNSELPAQQVNTLFIDAFGGLWFGTTQGLARFSEGRWDVYTQEDGLAGNRILHLNGSMTDGEARLFVSTTGGASELVYEDGGQLSIESYNTANSGLSSDTLASILPHTGVVYYGSQLGLDIRAEEAWTFVNQVTTPDEVVSLQQISSLGMTPHGWTFVGTLDHGVARVRYDEVDGVSGASSYSTEWSGLLSDRINDIHINGDGDQWYATDKGVAHHVGYETKKNWETYTELSSGIISNNVHAVAPDGKGITWAGTEKGIAIFDGISWYPFQDYENPDSYAVYDLDFDRDGSIWFASDRGVIHLDVSGSSAVRESFPASEEVKLTSYPNPASELITVTIEVPSPRQLSVFILDLNGRVLEQLCSGVRVNGTQSFTWDIQDGNGSLPEGIYLLLVRTEKESMARKIRISPSGQH